MIDEKITGTTPQQKDTMMTGHQEQSATPGLRESPSPWERPALASGIAFVIMQFGLIIQMFNQILNSLAGNCAGLDNFGITTPFGRRQFMLSQLSINPIIVHPGNVTFIERDDNCYTGGLGMVNRLDGLGHDSVISRNKAASGSH